MSLAPCDLGDLLISSQTHCTQLIDYWQKEENAGFFFLEAESKLMTLSKIHVAAHAFLNHRAVRQKRRRLSLTFSSYQNLPYLDKKSTVGDRIRSGIKKLYEAVTLAKSIEADTRPCQ
jgi:hypothetical protein